MADTQRTVAAILALLADNSAADISPQDIRDFAVSWRNTHGQIYVSTPAAVTISNTTNYFEVTAPTWTLSSGAHLWDESDGNGLLTYVGTEPMAAHIACSISFTVAGSNDVTHWRLGKNGTDDAASEIQRKVGTGADVGSSALHWITSVSAGDHISLFTRNATASDDITLETGNLQVVGMIS